MRKQYLVAASGLFLGLLFIIATHVYQTQQAQKLDFLAREDAEVFVRPHSPILGNPDARVTLVEFMDPACETCAAFSPFVKKLMDDNPGKVRLVLRYAPFHDGADDFVRILEAAGNQGKYWETLDIMYKSQDHWASHQNPQPHLLWDFVAMAGVDLDTVRSDMSETRIQRILEQDIADARALNVTKTPGFFVNGKPLTTFGFKQLQQLVESEIARHYPQ